MPFTPPIIGLHHIALNVVHLETCIEFYTEVLGFQVEWQPDVDNIYLTSGRDNLALHRVPNLASKEHPLAHFGLVVPSIEAVHQWYQHLKTHGIFLSHEPKQHRDGACSFYCSDPEGNAIQILYHPPLSGEKIANS